MINTFEILKERISFDSVANELGIEFNKSKKAICPFHDDKNPSLSLHSSGEYAHCFACDKTVDVIELEYLLGKYTSRFEAIKALNNRYGLGLKFNDSNQNNCKEFNDAFKLLEWYCDQSHKALLKNKQAQGWLSEKKGITLDQVKQLKIGCTGGGWLSGKVTDTSKQTAIKLGLLKEKDGQIYDAFRNKIIFPVWVKGRIKSIWTREYPDKKESNYKWVGLSNSEYIQHKPIAFVENLNCEICIITESIPDALAFQRIGHPVVALLGKDVSTNNKPYFRKSKSKLYLALDPDKSGKEAAYKLAKEFRGYVVDLGSEKDPDELLAGLGQSEFKKRVEISIKEAEFYLDHAVENRSIQEALTEIADIKFDHEKEEWINKLSKAKNKSKQSLRKDLKILEKEQKKKLKPETIENDQKVLYTATFDGLVDLVLHNNDVAFLVKDNNELKIKDSTLIEDVLYKPPPRGQIPIKCLPRAEKVLDYYDNDTDSELFDSLRDYHKRTSELPNENYYDLLTIWDFHTYLIERFNYSPLIWLFALPERGKSRTGKACIYVAYRGVHVESLRDSFIIRATNDLGATLFFDVMDIWRKAEKNGSEDILLQRFEKGTLVPRVLYPERGAFNDTKYFKIFGATIVATNVPVHNILETRALMLSMPQTNR